MYFVGMSLALAERSARRLHGRVYVEIRIPSSTPAGTVLSQTPNMWPVGLVVSTGPMKDGWTVVRPIHGYLQHDPESANWAAVIQWVNPASPPPPELALH